MLIQKALPADHTTLTRITKLSKAYWGYPKEFLQAWDEELTITPEYIRAYSVFKLNSEEKTLGYYSFEHVDEHLAHLENLFILPEYIGKGYGQLLLEDCLEKVRANGYKSIRLHSEPYAAGFYARFGFTVIGQFPSTIKDRFLPIMEKKLNTFPAKKS